MKSAENGIVPEVKNSVRGGLRGVEGGWRDRIRKAAEADKPMGNAGFVRSLLPSASDLWRFATRRQDPIGRKCTGWNYPLSPWRELREGPFLSAEVLIHSHVGTFVTTPQSVRLANSFLREELPCTRLHLLVALRT